MQEGGDLVVVICKSRIRITGSKGNCMIRSHTKHGVIHFGDCLEILPTLPEGSVDMVFADLPYGITACKWDTPIDLFRMWQQLGRVCKPNAAMVFTACQPFTSALVMSQPKWFKVEWVWNKNNSAGFGAAKYKPLTVCESLIVFSNGGGRCTYNPQMEERGKPRTKGGYSSSDNYAITPTQSKNNLYHPKSLLNQFPKAGNTGDRGLHPTQKPVALVEYMIHTYSNPGETILDPTMGSGTTAVAAINTGRRYVGIESDRDIYKLAKERILGVV